MLAIATSIVRRNVLATQLPLRTEHAIRNRYHRLQSIALDADGLKAADTSA